MKLVNINVEGMRHLDAVASFVDKEQPDVVCLQEANENHTRILEGLGYHTTFLPTMIENRDKEMLEEGIIFASKSDHTAESDYNFKPQPTIVLADRNNMRETIAQGYIIATIEVDAQSFTIVATHFTWTPNGESPNQNQIDDMETMITAFAKLPPHVLCGDMNIPRGYSFLYNKFLLHYTDAVPSKYQSSLDKKHHRVGDNPSKQHLFTDYMVDYIFTQTPYRAENVKLEFGISDHAAVIGDIYKN